MIYISDYSTIDITMFGKKLASIFVKEDKKNIAWQLTSNGRIRRVFLKEYDAVRGRYTVKPKAKSPKGIQTEPIFLFKTKGEAKQPVS